MKIAVFSHYFVPEIGAPSARIYDMAQQWIKRGHEVDVVTCFPNHPNGEIYPGYRLKRYLNEKIDGINVHRHWTYITPNKGFVKKTLGHLSYYPSALLFSQRHVKMPDVILGSSPTLFAASAASSVAWLKRVPTIIEIRDLWPAIFVELGVLKSRTIIRMLECWERHEYRAATKIVTVTESFTRNLITRGIPADKVSTIPNGADVDYWQPRAKPMALAQELGLDGKFILLYIGAHGISHALTKIVDAAEKLKGRNDIHFLFVGSGAEKEKVVHKASQLDLNNVTFLPPVQKEQVREYYALADLCLVPLRDIPLFDTFIPSKMFEIMAMGKPILAGVRGESAEILRRSQGAVVVEPEDSAAYAAEIETLANDRQRLIKMGANGRDFVVKEYSRERLANRYLEVFEDAIRIYKAKHR